MSDFPPQVGPADTFGEEIPSWPKVIGIISISWACIGLICSVCGGVQIVTGGMKQPGLEDMPNIAASPLSIISLLIGVVVAVLLLIAGVLLVQRKPIAKPLHVVYGVVGLGSLLLAVVAQFQGLAVFEQYLLDNAQKPEIQQMMKVPIMTIQRAIVISIDVVFAIYPVFCIFWFGIAKRNADMGSNEVSI